METAKTFSYKKILVWMLLAVSIVFLFLPWVTLHVPAYGKNYTPEEAFAAMAKDEYYYYGYGYYGEDVVEQVKEEFYDDVKYTAGDQMVKAIKDAEDGNLSPFAAVHLLNLLPSISHNSASDFSGTVAAVVWFFWFFLIAMILFLFVIAFCFTVEKRNLLIPHIACCTLILLTVVIAVGEANKIISTLYDYNLVLHLSAGGFLCIGFALAAYGATFLKDKRIPVSSKQSLSNNGGWSCPICGGSCRTDMVFCPTCGKEKPLPLRCTRCGRVVEKTQQFCPGCGQAINTEDVSQQSE